MPLIRKVDCFRVYVPDLEAGLSFYRDRLGHELIWRTNTAAGLRLPDSEAELVIQTERSEPETDLMVDSADYAARFIEESGGKIVVPPFDIQIGRCVVVEDPWGNVLVLLDGSKGMLETDADGNVIGKVLHEHGMEEMTEGDDDLLRFEAQGALPLPETKDQGHVEHDGARIWYAAYGSGSPIILLHGGLGNSGNWGYQVPALIESGYRAIVIDSRGHGRSTRDERPYSYKLMASDVLAVMDELQIDKAALVGWSDGACTSLVLASKTPDRVAGVFFFACNMDPSGTKEFEFTPIVQRCFNRHVRDYRQLSSTPGQFDEFAEAVGLMQKTQPNFAADDLSRIHVPVTIVHSEHDEFIKREHAEYLARTLPNAEFVYLPGVSHFAPLQKPGQFNNTILAFLRRAFPATQ